MTQTFVTATGSFTDPGNFPAGANNTVYAIGCGGNGGARQSSSRGGAAGGGGAFAVATNLAPTFPVGCTIRASSAATSSTASVRSAFGTYVIADHGLAASTSTAGAGGIVANCTPTVGAFKGGVGIYNGSAASRNGAGGGGAGGPHGAGGDAVAAQLGIGAAGDAGVTSSVAAGVAGTAGTWFNPTHGPGSGGGGGVFNPSGAPGVGGNYGGGGGGRHTGDTGAAVIGGPGLVCLNYIPTTPTTGKGFTLVGHVSAAAPAGFSDATTAAIDTTNADLIILGLGQNVTASPLGGPADSLSHTWTPLTLQTENSADSWCRLYYLQGTNIGTASHTFSMLGGNGTWGIVFALAFSGSDSLPFDVENGATGSGTSFAVGSVTPTLNSSLVVSLLCVGNAGVMPMAATGLSVVDSFSYGNNFGGAIGYVIQTTLAAINPTWSWVSTTQGSAAIAVFRSKPRTITTGGTQEQSLAKNVASNKFLALTAAETVAASETKSVPSTTNPLALALTQAMASAYFLSAYRIIATTAANIAALATASTRYRSYVVTSAETIASAKATSHLLAATKANTASERLKASTSYAVTQAATLAYRVTVGVIRRYVGDDVVSDTIKVATKLLSLQDDQEHSVDHRGLIRRSLGHAHEDDVQNSVQRLAKPLALTLGNTQAFRLVNSIGISLAATAAQALASIRAMAHSIATTSAQAVALAKARTWVKAYAATNAEVSNAVKAASAIRTMTEAQSTANVSGIRRRASTTSTNTAALTSAKALLLAKAATEAQVAASVAAIAHALSVAAASVVAAVKAISPSPLATTSTETVGSNVMRAQLKAVAVLSTQAIACAQFIGRIIGLTQDETVSSPLSHPQQSAVTQANTAARLAGILKSLALTATETVYENGIRAQQKALGVVSAQSALRAGAAIAKLAALTSAETVSAVKAASLHLAVAASFVVAERVALALHLALTSPQTLASSARRAFLKAAALAEAQSVQAVRATSKPLAAFQAQVATMSRAMAKAVSVAQASVLAVGRAIARQVSVVTAQIAGSFAGRLFYWTVGALSPEQANTKEGSPARKVPLAVIQASLLTATKAVQPRAFTVTQADTAGAFEWFYHPRPIHEHPNVAWLPAADRTTVLPGTIIDIPLPASDRLLVLSPAIRFVTLPEEEDAVSGFTDTEPPFFSPFDPADEETCTFNWSRRAWPNDTILFASVQSVPAGLNIVGPAFIDGLLVEVTLGPFTPPYTPINYGLRCTAVFRSGRVSHFTVPIEIRTL